MFCFWNSVGHGTSLPCGCVFIWRSYGFIHKRHIILQAGLPLLQLVSDFCRFSFLQLGFSCYIVSCNVLDLDMTLNTPTSVTFRYIHLYESFFFCLTHNRKRGQVFKIIFGESLRQLTLSSVWLISLVMYTLSNCSIQIS